MPSDREFFDSIIQTIADHPGSQVIPMDCNGNFGWSVYWEDDGEEGSEQFLIPVGQVVRTSSMDPFMRAALLSESREVFNRILLRAGSYSW